MILRYPLIVRTTTFSGVVKKQYIYQSNGSPTTAYQPNDEVEIDDCVLGVYMESTSLTIRVFSPHHQRTILVGPKFAYHINFIPCGAQNVTMCNWKELVGNLHISDMWFCTRINENRDSNTTISKIEHAIAMSRKYKNRLE